MIWMLPVPRISVFLYDGPDGNCLDGPDFVALLDEVCFEVLDTFPAEAFETAL